MHIMLVWRPHPQMEVVCMQSGIKSIHEFYQQVAHILRAPTSAPFPPLNLHLIFQRRSFRIR